MRLFSGLIDETIDEVAFLTGGQKGRVFDGLWL